MAAVTRSGDVYTWGNSGSGRLGVMEKRGSVFNHFLLPHPISYFRSREQEVIQVACGAMHTLFLTSDGERLFTRVNENYVLNLCTLSKYT